MGFFSLLLFLTGFILLASVSVILILLTALKARRRDREMWSSSSFQNRLNALICAAAAASTAAAASPDCCPVSQLCYQKLSIVKRKKSEEVVDCSFCLSGIEEWQEIRELKCQHLFHRVCLDRWIQQPRNTCPICRSSLLS